MHQTIIIENEVKNLDCLRNQTDSFMAKAAVPKNIITAIELVIEELFINIVTYAYNDDIKHKIKVLISAFGDRIELEVIDDGRAFNPLNETRKKIDPKIDRPSQPIGGMGIFLVMNVMDNTDYQRKNLQNHLKLVKHFPQKTN